MLAGHVHDLRLGGQRQPPLLQGPLVRPLGVVLRHQEHDPAVVGPHPTVHQLAVVRVGVPVDDQGAHDPQGVLVTLTDALSDLVVRCAVLLQQPLLVLPRQCRAGGGGEGLLDAVEEPAGHAVEGLVGQAPGEGLTGRRHEQHTAHLLAQGPQLPRHLQGDVGAAGLGREQVGTFRLQPQHLPDVRRRHLLHRGRRGVLAGQAPLLQPVELLALGQMSGDLREGGDLTGEGVDGEHGGPDGAGTDGHRRADLGVLGVQLDQRRGGRDGRMVEEVSDADVVPGAADASDDLRDQQGVAAQLEEVVLGADLVQAQYLGPHLREEFLRLAGRGDVRAAAGAVRFRHRQRRPVDLAVGGQRQP